MYSKRAGTSGIRGQLYETKLISLLYFRAFHDRNIEEFHIAANVDSIGSFADICFKAKVDEIDKAVAVFIQTKHRENENQTLKIDWANYFDSYLKIRKSFKESNDNLVFNGTFDETECLFVVYTTAKGVLSNDSVTSAFASKLNYLIDTVNIESKDTRDPAGNSGSAMQVQRREENVGFLCKIAIKEQVTSLAERLAIFLNDEVNFQTMLSDELFQIYHVLLAKQVLEISDIQTDGHRVASFRNDFFDTNEEYLTLFKDTLFKEILKKQTNAPVDLEKLLSEYLDEPNDAKKLSKLIGTVITHNNGRIDFDKQLMKEFKPQLNQYVSRSTVNEAIELAVKDMLLSRQFKVPAAFGNKDLNIWGSDEEIDIVINQLASIIIDLLKTSNSCDHVVLEKSFEDGFLQINGGIAGVIGNIFVLDEATKLMKIIDNSESLGTHAKRLYKKLSDEVYNLHDFKFCFKIDKLPKLSFDCSEYEESLAKDFLKKLLFYTKQADEEGVQKHLKTEIEEYQKDFPNYFQVKTDAIFLKYHDAIQKWWLEPKHATYLTRNSDLFQKSISNIIKDPLMSSINVTFTNKIKQYDYKFTEEAVSSLQLQEQHLSGVIITENSELTVVKVMQHLKNKEYVVLDLEYIVNLPTNDRNALRAELADSNPGKVLIFVCDRIRNSRNEKRLLQNISNAVQNKRTIVITNDMKSYEMLQKYFSKADNVIYDEKITLIDMTEDSQKTILENARVVFQGTEVRIDLILDDKSKAYVKGDVLNQIISEETIVVGKQVINRSYQEIAHLYVDRRVKKMGGVDICFKTLNDGEEDVILVTSEPGMGKSILLTHLSLKTKKLNPEIWIVRINLLEYSKEFSKWKEEKTSIGLLQTLKLMCRAILRDKPGNDNNIVEIALQEGDNVVTLKDCSGDHSTEFELKLFLHFYEKGKLIFLFDGFDEICPHYTNEVIQCLKTISSSKHRTWITSRSYNEVKIILQREFGPAYEIENFSYMEMQKYLEKYWQYNMRLEALDKTQLENVRSFIDYMSKLEDVKLHGFAIQLHSVYISAALYLLSEIKYKHIPLWKVNKKYDETFYSKLKDYDDMSSFYEDNRDGNPLHLLLAAVFVETNIKSVSTNTVKWNLEVDGFTFFERFLETKMKTIRFEEKNEMNIYKPDIIITYDKELADFILKHKKLAAYAVFKQLSHKLFSSKDLEEIQTTIGYIEKGEEKTGLVYTETNGVPTFILSEYFAVEYICGCLKNEEDIEKQKSWMDFIFNDMFSIESLVNVRSILDSKLSTDSKLMGIFENNKEVIFNLIMEQGRVYTEYIANICGLHPVEQNIGKRHWALSEALVQQLQNFVSFFTEILRCYINKSNVDDFLVTVKTSQLLSSACRYKSDALVILVLELVRKIDETKLSSILLDNFPLVPRSTIASYTYLSSEEIVARLLVYEDCVASQQASVSTSSGFSSGPLTASLPSDNSTSSRTSRPLSFNLLRRSSLTSSLSLVHYASGNRRRSL